MDNVKREVKIVLSPSEEALKTLREEYQKLVGEEYDADLWRKMYAEASTVTVYKNITLNDAQKIAEPIRIQHPDQHVNIIADEGRSWIGNVTWNDQMQMFFEYQTYTEEGKKLAEARQKEAKELGIIASWE